jgi:uncharacterized protein (TIGR00245 family)
VGASVVVVGPRLAVVLIALTALAAVAGRLSGLGQDRPVVIAVVRATVQLAAVSAVLLVVVRSLVLSTLFILLMLTVATATSTGRVTGRGLRSPGSLDRLLPMALPITGGAAPVIALVLASGTVPLRGVAVIPVAGILIGGAMTATTLTGRRLLEGLSADEDEIEARLSLGDRIREALAPTVRQAIKTGLVPAIDQTRNVGIVTLPGTFVGLVLGGASPAEAARVQLTVLLTLLAVELLSATVIAELIVRTRIAPGERLREDVADVRR